MRRPPPALRNALVYAGLVRRGFERGAAAGTLVLAAQGVTAVGVATERLSRRRGA